MFARWIRIFSWLCFAALGSGSTWATTFYTSQEAFIADAEPVFTYGFDGVAPRAGVSSGSIMVAGVSFDSTVIPFTIDAAYNATYGVSFFSGQSPDSQPSSVTVKVYDRTAAAFTYGGYLTLPGSTVTITLNSGETFTDTMPAAGTTKFAGFISSDPIRSLTFSTIANTDPQQYAYTMDIVQFQVPVPEPASAALLAVGLLGLRRGMRTRRR